MINNLTDISIQHLMVKGKQVICWDSNLKGISVRVGKRTKTYVVMVGKDRKQVSLGRLSSVSQPDTVSYGTTTGVVKPVKSTHGQVSWRFLGCGMRSVQTEKVNANRVILLRELRQIDEVWLSSLFS